MALLRPTVMMARIDILRMLQEAENQRMNALLTAWQKEIDAAAEAAAEAAARDARYDGARAAELHTQQLAEQTRRDLAAQDARNLADRSALESYLYGVVQQALAGYDVSISLPEGVNVASSLIVAANDAELSTILADAEAAEDDASRHAQRSASWAIGHGLIPHPTDLGVLAQAFEPDAAWGEHFASLGAKLDAHQTAKNSPAMLQAKVGGSRLDVVKSCVKAMDRYGGGRTLALVARPTSIASLSAPNTPVAARGRPPIDNVVRGIFG